MVKREKTLAFYDGVNETAGTILVKDGDTRIFFYFSMSFSIKNWDCAKCARRGVGLFNGFFRVAKKNGRCLPISLRQASSLIGPR